MALTEARSRQSIRTNLQVLGALMLRESRMAFGTSHWGYLWAILQPGVTLCFLIFIFLLIGRHAPFGESLALFFATSVLCLEYFGKLSSSLMRSFSSNHSLFAYPPVKRIDTIVARFLLVSSVYVLVWGLFHGGLVLWEGSHPPYRPELVLVSFAAIGLLGLALGLVNAVIFSRLSSWQHFEKALHRPLFFLSGAFYMPSLLPPEATAVLQWNPVLQAIELGRMGFYPDYHSEILAPGYLALFIGIFLTVGFCAEWATRSGRS
ncbi:ABC transporter permease [Paracoccus litorisediminis]|uniref:ABC transporter permease n=1 Tax=Paracoccus litorisediminis TaxID=2006130 RepID=UPI00372F4D0B